MIGSPLQTEPLIHLGPVPITQPVVVTWVLIITLIVASAFITHRLKLLPGKLQSVAELIVEAIDHQIGEVLESEPFRYRPLIGTIFLFVLIANWSSVIPGVKPPTAHIETDAALALIVFLATIVFGVRANGVLGYLKTFAQPTWVMAPINLIEQITRTFSLLVRLFGNVMSGVFVVGIVLTLAGLLVPIPLMALDLLTGAVQAYIFAILACVFIAAAVNAKEEAPRNDLKRGSST